MNETNDIAVQIKEQALKYIQGAIRVYGQTLEESAYKYKAIERDGETSSAKILLQLLIIYAISGVSFRVIAVYGFMMNAVNVTDEAWRQRFQKSSAWVLFLLQTSLDSLAPTSLCFSSNGQNMQVYLIDATMFKQVGKKGKELRAHMCYNLTKGSMEEVTVTDNHTAEGAQVFAIKPGSLYIGDAGYGRGVHLEHISSKGGYALFRLTPNQVKLAKDVKGRNKIDVTALFSKKKKYLDVKCFVHTKNGRYTPVRIIAGRLPADKALLAGERKIRESRRRQSQIREATLLFSGWVVLMTNADDSHCAKSLLHLYRSRWQIELLFKRIKQFLGIKRLKKASLEHSKLLVLLWLLVWSAVERKALEAEIQLMLRDDDLSRYSPWVMSSIIFKQLQVMVNAGWAFAFNPALHAHRIYPLMRNHKDGRHNQYSDLRSILFFGQIGLPRKNKLTA